MSGRTITDRVRLIELFERRMGVEATIASWTVLTLFLADAAFSPGTRQTYMANLRAWFQWLILTDVREDNPMGKLPKGKPVRRKPRPVTIVQLDKILETRMRTRTRSMILLGAYAGLRVHEIAKFQAEDIIDAGTIRVLGKGGFYDELPLHPLIAGAARSMPAEGYWFPSYVRPGPLLPNSVSTIIGDVMRRAGMPENRTAHSLRHFWGTEIRRTTGDLAITQKLMRHANVASTMLYVDVGEDEKRAAVLGLPVPGRLRLVA